MESETNDKFPEFCLTFSPNWYLPQIFSCNSNDICAFGCNEEVFLMHQPQKKIITSIYMKMPEVYKIKESNLKKICAVYINLKYLIFTNVRGYISIVDIQSPDYSQLYFGDLEIDKEIIFIHELSMTSEFELNFVMADNETYIISSKFNGEFLEREVLERKGKTAKIKTFEILSVQNEIYCLKILDDGLLTIWDSTFRKIIYFKDTKVRILYATSLFKGQYLYVALLSRSNNFLILKFNLSEIERTYSKTNSKITDGYVEVLSSIDLEFEYPKKISDDPEIQKAIPNFIFLDDQRIFLAGKMGELYELWLKVIEKKKSIIFKPFSAGELMGTEEEEESKEFEEDYELAEDNPHYRNIYFMKICKFDNKGVITTISVDRKICFWKYNPVGNVKIEWNIACLGGKVYKLATSLTEKSNILCACGDSTLRIWNIDKKTNRFFTIGIWKGLKDLTFSQIKYHPTDGSLIAYSTDCLKNGKKTMSAITVGVYELYNQSPLITFNGQKSLTVTFMEWISLDAVKLLSNPIFKDEIKKLIKNEIYMANILSNKVSPKKNNNSQEISWKVSKNSKTQKGKINNDFILIHSKEIGFLLVDLSASKIVPFLPGIELIGAEADLKIIHLEKFIRILLALGDAHGVVTFIMFDNMNNFSTKMFTTVHQQFIPTIKLSRLSSDGTIYCAAGSYDRTISLYKIPKINELSTNCSLITDYEKLKSKFRISKVQWSPLNFHMLLNTCEKHYTVQIWNCDDSIAVPSKDRQIANVRGHRGFILDASFSELNPNIIITASDDQTVKVWEIPKIKNKTIPNKKKTNRNKKPGKAQKNSSDSDSTPGLAGDLDTITEISSVSEKSDAS